MIPVRKEWLLIMSLAVTGCASAPEAPRLAALEDFTAPSAWTVWPEAWGGKAEIAPASGPEGSAALRFTGPGIAYRELQPTGSTDWKLSGGLAFWVKGDGSPLYGTIVVGPPGKGSWEQGFVHAGMTGHAFYFPLADTNWHRVTAAWSDFIPEGPHPAIGEAGGLQPADIRVLRLGNRWKYWRNYDAYPPFSYEVAEVALVGALPRPRAAGATPAVASVLEKMRRGEPVRILCAGDSITAGAGTAGDQRYWVLLQDQLRKGFRNDRIVVEGWGIGGATLLDALPWIDWMLGPEPPDLVTLMFGTNDCSCYGPDFFAWCLRQAQARIGAASRGRTAVLPFATLPGLKEYATKTDPYADAVRRTAAEKGGAVLDLSAAFKALEPAALQACFADGVHLNANGHAFVADTVAGYMMPATNSERTRP